MVSPRITSVSYLFHIGAPQAFSYHISITSISQQHHNNITTISQRYHEDITSVSPVSHRYHIGFTLERRSFVLFTQEVPGCPASRPTRRPAERSARRTTRRPARRPTIRPTRRPARRPARHPAGCPAGCPGKSAGQQQEEEQQEQEKKVWRPPATAESSRTASLARTTRTRKRNRNRFPGWTHPPTSNIILLCLMPQMAPSR